jgi:glycosyltransferase involved in cell wall biosynthesis
MELLFTTIIFVRHGCDVIQICNPPDLLFLVARIFRALFGVKLVFDHHDPFPELLREKFPRHRVLHRLALRCEKWTFARADFVISTSSALARVAHLRGGVPSDRIEIVRSAPDPGIFSPAGRAPSDNGPHVIAYVGIMGSQDGVDILVETARILVRELGRRDIRFVLAGDGPELMALKARTATLGLEDYLEFRGFIDRQGVVALLREASLGVCPDPPTPFNAMLTMNKVLEYMAMGLPIVMFDLAESRAIAGAAAAIVTEPSGHALARQLAGLIDDPAERRRMAEIGPLRMASDFSWTSQREKYLEVYARLWNLGQPTETRPVVTGSATAGGAGSA